MVQKVSQKEKLVELILRVSSNKVSKKKKRGQEKGTEREQKFIISAKREKKIYGQSASIPSVQQKKRLSADIECTDLYTDIGVK